METSQKTPPQTGLLTWLLNAIAEVVRALVPNVENVAQSVRTTKKQATRDAYNALLLKREALSKRVASDMAALKELDARIIELRRQLNL